MRMYTRKTNDRSLECGAPGLVLPPVQSINERELTLVETF